MPGAGMDIRFERSGQMILEYEMLNYGVPGVTHLEQMH